MKILAAVLQEKGKPIPYSKSQPLVIERLELEEPDRDEVLIKMWYVGLCHSDLSVINGSRPRPTPMVLGHEAVGQVIKTGESVNNVTVGDIVCCLFVPSCGQCEPCRAGRPTTCMPGAKANGAGVLLCGKTHLYRLLENSGKREPVYHLGGTSGFATHAVLSKHSVVKIDPSMPPEYAALFGCGVITGVGAVTNAAQVELGASVAIVGLGGVGFCGLLGAVACGASIILAVDLDENKLKQAIELGATHTYQVKKETAIPQVVEDIRKLISNNGVDYAFEMAGNGPALQIAYGITRAGGTTVTIGLPDPKVNVAIPQVSIVAEERTIIGSYLGSGVGSRDIPRYVELYKRGKLPLEKLVSGMISLEQINEGFDRLERGEVIRLLVNLKEKNAI
eukprot:jgi/Galph1/1793/GphlegSOOS_G468.1